MEPGKKEPDSTDKNSDNKGLDTPEQGSNKGLDPLTSKPYIVDVTLKNKVKRMKHLEIIKSAVTKSLNNQDFKVVFNYVSDKKVRMSFFVWKDKKQEISAKELDMHCASIFHYLQPHNIENNSNGEVQNKETLIKSFLQVTEVKVQPTLCVATITLENSTEDKVKAMENAIKRFFCEIYYPYDFGVEVKEDYTLLEIQAWMQFPHNVEDEKQQLDMEQIMRDNLEKLLELQELKEIHLTIKRRQKPTLCIAEIKLAAKSVNAKKVELLENAIKRFFSEKYSHLEFEAKIKGGNTLLEIYSWMRIPDNTEEEKQQLYLELIVRNDLENIVELKEFKDVS